jgi:hypothetical protein
VANVSGSAHPGRPALLLWVAFALAATGCFSLRPPAAGGEEGEAAASLGAFEVASAGGPRARIVPTACSSGDPSHFLGADLVDEGAQLVVRLVVDPLAGPAVRVFDLAAPFDRSVVYFREDCTTFTFSLEPTGWIINEVHVRRLDLELDCESEEGARIAGHASARACD